MFLVEGCVRFVCRLEVKRSNILKEWMIIALDQEMHALHLPPGSLVKMKSCWTDVTDVVVTKSITVTDEQA